MSENSLNRSQLAEEFTRQTGLILFYWKKQYLVYNGYQYEEVPKEDIKCKLSSFLQNLDETKKKVTTHLLGDVLANLNGQVHLDSTIELPTIMNGEKGYLPARHLISMKNGILDLKKLTEGHERPLLERSWQLITRSSLPYDFDPIARCPRWLKFLEEIQPDPGVRDLLQEWFGYNMVYDTTYNKFALFVGEGANGKSVCCVVLRELLGGKNVSAVGLESFNPTRTFPLAITIGKLANIVEEIGETSKPAVGILKQFTSGSTMTIERKGVDAFNSIPSARLTFATNALPQFVDRSNGLWRRILLIPFNTQILDEKKQDKRLVDPSFWRQSGELSGIFNWGLSGLARLRKNCKFTEPQICLEAKNSYQKECNPAQSFLNDHCEASNGAELPLAPLYSLYHTHLTSNGQKPLGSPQFAKEIRKVFPDARRSPNAVRLPGKLRCPIYYGIKYKSDSSDGGIGDIDGRDNSYRGNTTNIGSII